GQRDLELLGDVLATAHVGHHRETPDAGLAPRCQLDELVDESGRKVVDHQPPEVLEDLHRLRLASARQHGDEEQLHQPTGALWRCSYTVSASRFPIPGTRANSSTLASRTRLADPTCLMSRR